jgi:catechol 2,3-dioxygenase-like lactoylglutathione lyase family enzyme
VNPIRAATLSVSDLDAAVTRYRTWLDYRVLETGPFDLDLAAALGAPKASGARQAVLRPASGSSTYLRLVELPPTPGYRAMRSFGWAAIEICIQDVHATHARLRESPFEIIGPPSAISALPSIHPMQVSGPDGEIIFLTEIKTGGPGSGLPTARSHVDALFICVLACRDMPMMASWVSSQLGAGLAPEIAIPYRMIARSFDLPVEQLHRIATAERDGHIFLEFDQYPVGATERPQMPGYLPPGVSVVTLLHSNLDTVAGSWFTQPICREGAIYEGRRVGVLRAPEGALIELVESA